MEEFVRFTQDSKVCMAKAGIKSHKCNIANYVDGDPFCEKDWMNSLIFTSSPLGIFMMFISYPLQSIKPPVPGRGLCNLTKNNKYCFLIV